jgi:hypothetical protein
MRTVGHFHSGELGANLRTGQLLKLLGGHAIWRHKPDQG